MQRSWVLAAVAAALVVTTVAYLVVHERDGGSPQVRADGSSTSTSALASTTDAAPSTSTADTTTTTTVPVTVTAAPSTTGQAGTSSTRGTTVPAPPTTTTTRPAPPFQSSVEPVTAAQLGSSWKPGMGCPEPDQLRAVNVSHWGYDGEVHVGRLIVAATQADRMVAIFREVYAARFPIERMVPIDAYGGDDKASMRANNTSGFNCRYVSGTTTLSEHGLGAAVDVNPLVNPYVKGSTVDPPEGAPYADRSRSDPGMIHAGDAVVRAFAAQGWRWGGYWSSGQDYQHFSASGR